MSTYIIEDAQINWETLINNLRNNPTALDYEHFTAIVRTYWKQKEHKEQLQSDCIEIYKSLEQFKPQSQAFFLSLIFDFNIRRWIEDIMPTIFEKLLTQEKSSDHRFLIFRYFLAFEFQYLSSTPDISKLVTILGKQTSIQETIFILIQINPHFSNNIYAEEKIKQEAIELLQSYVQHSSLTVRYFAAYELLKAQNFEVSEDIIEIVLEVFVHPETVIQLFFDIFYTFKQLPKRSLTNNTVNQPTNTNQPPTPEEFYLTKHIQAFQLTGKKQYTYIIPQLLKKLKPGAQASFLVETIIQMGFGPISIRQQNYFTPLQEHILTLFATQAWLWQDEAIRNMLEAIEIPSGEMELSLLLNQQEAKGILPDFSKLYEVDWKNTEHAYGSATDVPQLFIRICAEDAEVRKAAWWHLYGNLFHQGTRYPATVLAIPFFIELLEYEGVPEKQKILLYLTNCLLGYPEYYIHQIPDYEGDFFNPEYDPDQVMKGLYEAVAKGIPTYLQFMQQGNNEEKQAAIFLLAWFYPLQQKIVPALKYFIEEEEESIIQSNILLAISYLTTHDSSNDWVAFFEQWFQQSKDDQVGDDWLKLASAVALYRLGVHQQRPEVLQTLLDFMAVAMLKNETITEEDEEHKEENEDTEAIETDDHDDYEEDNTVEEAWLSFPWIDEAGNPETFIAGFFENLPPDQNQLVSQALMIKIKNGSLFETVELTRILLRLNFDPHSPNQEPLELNQLNETQISLLKELLEINQLWRVGNNTMMIRSYGLPTSQKELQEFLTM